MTARPLPAVEIHRPETGFDRYRWPLLFLAVIVFFMVFRGLLPGWLVTPPEAWTDALPLPFLVFGEGFWPSLTFPGSDIAGWFNAIVEFLREHEIFGLFVFKDFTRWLGGLTVYPLDFSEALVIAGFPYRSIKIPFEIPAIPWVVSMGLAAILGWYVKGWRLALLAACCVTYFAVFNLWKPAMTTLSLVLVAAPIAAGIGLGLGILALKYKSLERTLWPILNLLQCLPHFGYLIPVVVFVGLAHRSGAIATILFAVPVMAKVSMVALRTVPQEVLEAGVMAGCTPRQMLWSVRIPAARRTLMVGINQVIMLCLAMQVISSFIGARGLGIDLLFRLQNLQLGRALEIGIALVLMAITLDRLSQALAEKEPVHRPEGPFWVVHPYLTAAGLVLVVGSILAFFVPEAAKLPRSLTISVGRSIDPAIKDVVSFLYDPLSFIRDTLPEYVLVPIREAFKAFPWIGFMGLLALAGWRLGGWRMASVVALYIAFIVLSSWWTEFMVTTFLVCTAVVVCVLFGFPLAVWASRKESTSKAVTFLCDTFQTFPSFIYLIPCVMLFQVGTISQLMAIVIYASIPVVRFTVLGLRGVPQHIIEGAITSGCTPRQILWKVRFPVALPEIMLGLNQTIMFGLFMVMIAGFIGGNNDLAREIFKAKAQNDAGLALLLALNVAFLGLATDRLLQAWSTERKKQLGLD